MLKYLISPAYLHRHSEGAGIARVESVGPEETVSAMWGAEGVEASVQMCLVRPFLLLPW